MGSLWSTLKTDTGLAESIPASRPHAELAVFDPIETFYNPMKRHSLLGYLSPVAFENQQTFNDIEAAQIGSRSRRTHPPKNEPLLISHEVYYGVQPTQPRR